ncbi:TetR/AcrR family transcriptional regulator [Nocardioides sp.]|uniref:TetR/AcrR family transcriptional regulator n=1 Tax=Nocardioides sp. TaxID=35761 RepID=UPI002B5EE45B|nr:TetR/AcrR family transcriptional regulator [Nocardioides sp.]HSX66305.1 TetR/AcrR family transcriptional regulator [Nocardioides sp.]
MTAQKWEDTTAARRASSRQGHRAPVRDRIIQAAAVAIEENGPDAATSQIAELAGVARPHVYRHFSSKEELLQEVARYAAGSLKDRVLPALEANGDAVDWIREPVKQAVEWASENPGLFLFLMGRNQARDLQRGRAGRSHFLGKIVEAAEAHLAAVGTVGTAGVPLDALFSGLKGMVDTSIVWWVRHQDEERDALVDRLSRQVGLIVQSGLAEHGIAVDETGVVSKFA